MKSTIKTLVPTLMLYLGLNILSGCSDNPDYQQLSRLRPTGPEESLPVEIINKNNTPVISVKLNWGRGLVKEYFLDNTGRTIKVEGFDISYNPPQFAFRTTYGYDSKGRVIFREDEDSKITPSPFGESHTQVTYKYNGDRLEEVIRNDIKKNAVFRLSATYDKSGQLIEEVQALNGKIVEDKNFIYPKSDIAIIIENRLGDKSATRDTLKWIDGHWY